MITTEGKIQIRRYLAGFVPNIAQSIALGVGQRVEAVGDTALQFELSRTAIELTSYDFTNNKLIFKGPVPDNFGGAVYEIALFSQPTNALAGTFGSRLVSTFEQSENWVDATTGLVEATWTPSVLAGGSARAGDDGLAHAPAVSTSKTSALKGVVLDFSGNSGADTFNFAYNVANANVGGLRFRFLTDASNYYDFSLGAQTSGYKITTVTKSAATVTGTPNWANITEIQVTTTANASGAASVMLDGIRVEDTDTVNADYVMVARKVLVSPFNIQTGKSMDVEYALDITIV